MLRPVRIARVWNETPVLRGIAFEPSELARAHESPGQYVRAAVGRGAEGYFALANAPGRPLEILVKRGGEASDALVALATGDTLPLGPPEGPGYPVDRHAGRDLLLFAAGTGIAPIRAVVQHILADRSRWGAVRLYHGQRRADEFAYGAEHVAWNASGIRVVPVISGDDPHWRGARGYVQDALAADPPPVDDAVAYVCGMPAMEDAIVRGLAKLGMPADRVYRNH